MNEEMKPAESPLTFHDAEPPSAVNLVSLPEPAIAASARKGQKLITTLTLTSDNCRWPFGDPAKSGFHYCGRLPQSGRPYCDTHDRMSYQSSPRKKPS